MSYCCTMRCAIIVVLFLACCVHGDVIGVIVMTRHGDRTANYGNPWNFTESIDVLTPLGSVMLYGVGSLMRSMYINDSSSTNIQGINPVFDPTQISVLSSDNEVILNSATAFLQGLFPPDANISSTLTNGSTYTPPLQGYQYIPINTQPDSTDLTLDGYEDCPSATVAVDAFQNSTQFLSVQSGNQTFLNSLAEWLGGRPIALEYAWDMFDYLNYQYHYNATVYDTCPLNRSPNFVLSPTTKSIRGTTVRSRTSEARRS